MIVEADLHLAQIVETIFSTMLRTDARLVDEASVAGDLLESAVRIDGAWSGEIALEMPPATAAALAAAMLSTPPDRISFEDAEDVAAELANMIGGNFKASLPSPSRLSLPTVRRGGSDGAVEDLAGSVFRCAAGLFRVQVQSIEPSVQSFEGVGTRPKSSP